MPRPETLTSKDLAEIGEIAFNLGLEEHGQWMLVAAYDEADGIPHGNVEDLISEVREAAISQWADVRLSVSQKALLKIASVMLPLVLLCIAHCRQNESYPNAICSHTLAKLKGQSFINSAQDSSQTVPPHRIRSGQPGQLAF